MKKIIFVCTGNTCRSPMAEGMFKKYLDDMGICDVSVSSAGLAAFGGDEVSKNAVLAAEMYEADISSHRSRSFSPYNIGECDLIVCMTDRHKLSLLPYVDEEKLLSINVSDPYGGELSDYEHCATLIYSSFEEILFRLIGYEIAAMNEEILPQIVELEKKSFSSPWSENSLYAELEKADSRFYTAKMAKILLGYIGANNICGEVYITNVAVDKKWRRRKIAQALIAKLIEKSREENAEFITLEVRKSNTAAINLYSKLGFEKLGERKNFYENPTEDAYIMTLNLQKED